MQGRILEYDYGMKLNEGDEDSDAGAGNDILVWLYPWAKGLFVE